MLLAACPALPGSRASPMPNLHVTVQLLPDPPPAGNCCKVVLINPTKQGVYVRCTVTAYRPDGEVAFQGSLSGASSGWSAPPGRNVGGDSAVVANGGHTLGWHRHWHLSTRCSAFVWHGPPPI
jgi:hypothetical protein